jgi:hypothetical protein
MDTMTCDMCDLEYTEPSMGGPGVCPWCDTGHNRDGSRWTYREAIERGEARLRRIAELTATDAGDAQEGRNE